MDWLRKLDAALDSTIFSNDRKEDQDEPSEEEEGTKEFAFDYVSNEFDDAPQNDISHDSIIQNEVTVDQRVASSNPSFQTHVNHARNTDWKKRPSAPPLGLPGMLRPVLRTPDSDSSSDESDEEEEQVHAQEGDDNRMNRLQDAPRLIETVIQQSVSPISSPEKKTLQIVSVGGGETIPSHLKTPSLFEISNPERNHDNGDRQNSIQNSQEKDIPKRDDTANKDVLVDTTTITTPSRSLPLSLPSSQYTSPPRRHKSPVVIMPSDEPIVHGTKHERNAIEEETSDNVDSDPHNQISIPSKPQNDDNSQEDRSSSLEQSTVVLEQDSMNPPFIIDAAHPMDTLASSSSSSGNNTSLPSRLKSESGATDRKSAPVTNEKNEEFRATFGDFMPSYHYDDDDDKLSDISALEGEDYESDQIVPWEDDITHSNFKPSMNCHGVVHVRLLRAQHMPCSSGTVIQAIIHLPPWKGKVRSKTETTYIGPSKAGVCVRWDKKSLDHEDDLSLGEDDAQPPCISMVHAYNDEDTPIPDITIEMKDKALQMFESDLCSLSLSCAPLMESPGQFRRRWCRMITSNSKDPNQDEIENDPLLLIEASFEPTNFDETSSSEAAADDTVMDFKSEPNTAVENIEEVRSRSNTAETNDNSSQAQLSARTKTSQSQKKLSSKPHMFRNYTMLRPTFCALCDKMIMWKFKGYQCEVCNLDCCSDCLLRIDVEMPCGSKEAQNQVNKLQNSRFSLSRVYDMIAPPKDGPKSSDANKENVDPNSDDKHQLRIDGVGKMHLKIKQACIYSEQFAPEAEIKHILASGDRWLRKGDYYVRVSWTGSTDTKRTKTVFQTSKPRFDSAQMSITASHYGTEFKIEVVDAHTDKTIGTKLLTTQGLLQWQRDILAKQRALTWETIFKQRPLHLAKKTAILELRSGVKSGFGLDFYNSSKIGDGYRAGEICGWVEVEVGFDENPELYSNHRPQPCPMRPDDDFNVDLIQLHIARITSLIEDLSKLLESYQYVISWKNPALTSMCMIIFTSLCLRFNTEKVGSLPILFVILYMILCIGKRRQSGGYRLKLLQKEKEARLQEIKGVTVNYKKHRPIANLDISVLRGKNLSPHHGIPGSLVATVIWDPLKFADSFTKETIQKEDPTTKCIYILGETEGSSVTTNPEWHGIRSSDELKRLMQLLPSKNFLSIEQSRSDLTSMDIEGDDYASDQALHFPILQPITKKKLNPLKVEEDDENDFGDEDKTTESIELLPWESSKAAIIVQIGFADVLNKLPIFDQILGDVVIPVSHIAKGNMIEGWFEVLEKGAIDTLPTTDKDDNEAEDVAAASFLDRLTHTFDEEMNETFVKDADVHEEVETKIHRPKIYLKARLKLPDLHLPNDIDKETSIVIAEHLIRTAGIQSEDKGPGFIGSSINTFNTMAGMRSNVQNLQNQLSSVLNMIDMARNLFNFTCPEKSAFVLLCLCILWLILLIIPTRWIIFVAGNSQFITKFMAVYYPHTSPTSESREEKSKDTDHYDPYMTRIVNFFQGIPTDEDLRRYYFWEAVKVGEQEREILATKKRTARLTKLWKAQWFGHIELKSQNHLASGDDQRKWEWRPIFAIVQGHRFIWWLSEKDFDEGENPNGQIFFAGHSGLAGLSPLELRELEQNEIPLVVSLFGRDAMKTGQQLQTKISMLCPDRVAKESLEKAVLTACLDNKNE